MSEAPGADVRILGTRQAAARLSRRSVLAGLAAAGAGLVVTGCGRSDRVAANIAPDGELEDKLNIYTWGDYDDPALLKKFRKDFDVIVQVDSFGSNEELISKLSATRGTSGYDIVVPTGLVIPQMAHHKLLQPLDKKLLPNLSTMDPNFLKQPFDPENTYSVCKNWGTTGFVYDTQAINDDLETWKDFVTMATGKASGKVAVLEDPWEASGIGLGATATT
ncbi:extracellular solute-binding protein [Brevibacterium rongguiense]|uniref:extracellular solute-binding protein n=1 Tax=Brevibacterium rongguiense TaxID=2695267 RepID=UPI001925A4A2|nr:extracellular solute-binding protein [Brevibacterium rongguiense]